MSGARGTAGQQQDRKNAADRDRSVAGGKSGERGTRSQQQDRRNMDRARAAGNRAPGVGRNEGARGTGSSTAADHLVAIGRARTPSIPAGGVSTGNYPAQDNAYMDYAKAVGNYANRGFIDKALDWGLGGFYDPQEPMAGNPRSFAGGDWHSASNPGSIAGGLAGMFAGPFGSVLGPAMGNAYNAAGLPQAWHGGFEQPDLRGGPLGNTSNPMGGSFSDIGGVGGGIFGGGHTYASGGSPGGWGGVNSPLAGGGTGMGGMGGAPAGGVLAPQQNAQSPGAPVQSSIPSYPQFQWAQPWGNGGVLSPGQNNKWSWG